MEADPFEAISKKAVTIPERLFEILKRQSAEAGIPVNTLARHYIISGLETDGTSITNADATQIEAEISRLRAEPQRETYDDFLG